MDVDESGLRIWLFAVSWRVVLQCISVPSRWAISHIRGLPHYSKGNVAIIGDAVKDVLLSMFHYADFESRRMR